MRIAVTLLLVLFGAWGGVVVGQEEQVRKQPDYPVKIGSFPQEARTFFRQADGLPSNDVLDVVVGPDKAVYVATAKGLVTLRDGARRCGKPRGTRWSRVWRWSPRATSLRCCKARYISWQETELRRGSAKAPTPPIVRPA